MYVYVAAMREEMVLKIAILAEKFSTDPRWYVYTHLKICKYMNTSYGHLHTMPSEVRVCTIN